MLGDVVVKAPNEPHGFTKVEEHFEFISIADSEGIVQANDWDLEYL
jgi:quercetin dioxygenase-like cupin family protein